MRRLINRVGNELMPPIAAFVVFVLLWHGVTVFFKIEPLILPQPIAVATALGENGGYLLQHGAITVAEASLGFATGSVAALGLALLFHFSKMAESALYPYAIAFKAIPLVALAPLVVVWFGSGIASKVVLSAVISFFPILVSAVQGINSVDSDAVDLMRTMSATRWQILVKVRVPHALPAIFSGFKVASTFAVVGAVVAEFIGASRGIGYVIKSASYYLDTDLMFGAVIVAALSGISFFGLVVAIEHKIVFWQSHGEK